MRFKDNGIQALIESDSEVDIITLPYAAMLVSKNCHTNIGGQKIIVSSFEIIEIVLANIKIENKQNQT